MASDKYKRAVELAKARGYSSPYAERKVKALAKGFSSPRAEQTSRGVKRDYALERERARIRAQGAGFSSVAEKRAFMREPEGTSKELWQKRRILAFFGISEREFNRIRKANRDWARQYPLEQWTKINTYDTYVDSDTHNWTEQRVGYITSFYGAVVDPRTNHQSLYKLGGKKVARDAGGRPLKNGKRLTNKSQYYYLVKYGGIMQQDEFESRYGMTTG